MFKATPKYLEQQIELANKAREKAVKDILPRELETILKEPTVTREQKTSPRNSRKALVLRVNGKLIATRKSTAN